MTQPMDERVARMLEGLSQLTPTRAVGYRGCAADARFVSDGQVVTTQGLVASSRNPAVALAEDPAALYVIAGATGRYVAPFSARREEEEIVFLPPTVFALHSTVDLDGVAVRLVFELEPELGFKIADELIDQLRDRAAHDLSVAPAQAPIDPIRGKYVGDID